MLLAIFMHSASLKRKKCQYKAVPENTTIMMLSAHKQATISIIPLYYGANNFCPMNL